MSASAVKLRRLDLGRAASDPVVAAEVRALFRRGAVPDPRVREGARAILAAVKTGGRSHGIGCYGSAALPADPTIVPAGRAFRT